MLPFSLLLPVFFFLQYEIPRALACSSRTSRSSRGEGIVLAGAGVLGLLLLHLHGGGGRRRRRGAGGAAAVALVEGGAEAADERVEAAPRLAARALARLRLRRQRRRAAAVGRAGRLVDTRLAVAVEVAEELDRVRAAALTEL
nr:unnamed protein product [Digitaria exilis]